MPALVDILATVDEKLDEIAARPPAPPTAPAAERARPRTAPIPRLTLTREEAAAALGISLDSFERHVQPTLKVIRRGRMRLVPIGELARWAEQVAERTLP